MTDKGTPYIDDVRIYMHESASHAVLGFATGGETLELAITQDMLMKLIGDLQDLNAHWETRRRQVDPGAGKPGDTVAMAATRPEAVSFSTNLTTGDLAIVFSTQAGPQAFEIPKAAVPHLVDKMLRETERKAQKPPLSS